MVQTAPIPSPSTVLNEIYTQRREAPLSILSYAEPVLAPQARAQTSQSQSQPQDVASATLTPSSANADLEHYKDLFKKLKFSYEEQVTKEKYLRGIVGEPPILATSEENALLEEKLGVVKVELQSKKRGVEALVQEMEDLARDIATRYDSVNSSVQQLEVLPGEVDSLEAEVAELERQLAEKEGEVERSGDPRMNLSLEETERLIQEQRQKKEEMQREIEDLESALPTKTRECEEAEKELQELESRRNEITRMAREAQRSKEAGGRDLLEEQGRWYQSSEVVLKGLLGVQG